MLEAACFAAKQLGTELGMAPQRGVQGVKRNSPPQTRLEQLDEYEITTVGASAMCVLTTPLLAFELQHHVIFISICPGA